MLLAVYLSLAIYHLYLLIVMRKFIAGRWYQ